MDVEYALKKTQNGRSPGNDGFIYEFWKQYPRPDDDDDEKERKAKPDNNLSMKE
ncbi:uncharacterized protein B0H18DRAFT_1130157 [Fomitopsis serialis]|uniref:uncharacterized protein n=1 Tax=Fomitopsis serialis TaxID=139415 RepID=UPI002007980B|nr:uncharacterized protein B0H18DRAFT_1130157 [Neoantrodia serialis]KAH9910431.1 hypothetical protein B0H18DRAFT_1130157 [Neoantrodia serialis]